MMKTNLIYNFLFCLCFVFTVMNGNGQIRHGAIEYEITINLDKRFPSNNQTANRWGNSRGQNRTSTSGAQYLVEKATLYFNDTMSVFITHPPESMRDLNRTFLTSTVVNFKTNELTTHINLFGEEFLILDSLPQREWKFTSRERLIAGKMAKQALTQVNDSTTIYAWFDTDFFYSVGPESYSNLPGAILGLAYEDGSITYFATKIDREYPEIQGKLPLHKVRNGVSRKRFINDFVQQYDSSHRYYQLIKDMLIFF